MFPTPDKPAETIAEEPGYKSRVTQGFKRRIDEMYALLSDGEESDDDLLNDANTQPSFHSNAAKRSRISTSPEATTPKTDHVTSSTSGVRSAVHLSPPKKAVRAPCVLTRPPVGKDCISLTGIDGGRRVYLCVSKDESSETSKVGNITFNVMLIDTRSSR